MDRRRHRADRPRVENRSWVGGTVGVAGAGLDALGLVSDPAGLLIGTVRMMVRDAVAAVVSRLIVYAGELIASLGTATPLVVEQVSTLCASWAARISHWLKDLISSIRSLLRESDKLGKLIELLRSKLGHGAERDGGGTPPEGDEPQGPVETPSRPGEPAPPDFSNPDLDPNKVSGYAMNPDHPVGGNKYRVIHSATGLDVGDAARIEEQILDGVREGTPILGKADQYGQR